MKNTLKTAKQAFTTETRNEAKSLRACSLIVLNAFESFRDTFADAAEVVPGMDESNNKKMAFINASVLPLLPNIDGVHVNLTPDKKKAYTHAESLPVHVFNVPNVNEELGSTDPITGSRSVFHFVNVTREESVVLKTDKENGGAGVVYETKDGKRVKKLVTRKFYLTLSGGFSVREVLAAFCAAVGIDAAIMAEDARIAAEIESEKERKNAAAVLRANNAANNAATKAGEAAKTAATLAERAQEKRKKVATAEAACGITVKQAQEINRKNAAKVAEAAEVAQVTDDKMKGRGQRKKSNTRTKASEMVTK